MKIGNDRLSSIQIPSGMKVTIYEHDNYEGKSKTFTESIQCLDAEWNEFASSVVVEDMYYKPGYNQNSYITFYNDCYNKGYSKSLKPGTYKGNALGLLKKNISSFIIYGNLKVRVYLNNDNISGYNYTLNESTNCLSSTYNDKISSLVIEYDNNQGNNNNNGNNNNQYNNNNYGNSYVNIYSSCNYKGNSLRLAPGQYQGNNLGILKSAISSIEIPSNLQVKAYISSDYLSGNYYTISENISCMTSTLKNNIRSLVIEEKNQSSNYNNNPSVDSRVTIYVDGNYKGQSVSLLPGTYNSMSQIGFPDKALSSLTVPEGYRIVLYEFENFGGKKYTITQSKSGFSFSGWNDKASSIAVYRDR
ncbi:MAG: hypothetical protein ABIT35_10745 [Chitinophagaceae bacterium]